MDEDEIDILEDLMITEQDIQFAEEEFVKENNMLIYIYVAYLGNVNWVKEKIEKEKAVTLKGVFKVSKEDIIDIKEQTNSASIKIGILEGEYYKIDKRIIQSSFDVYFSKDIDFDISYFRYGGHKKSIFAVMNDVLKRRESLYIGGEKADISFLQFKEIIKSFPNAYERKIYMDARVYQVLENELGNLVDYHKKLESYREKKQYTVKREELFDNIKKYEIEKYEEILEHLINMLADKEKYSEKQWQKEIIKILLLLFPKYIACFDEVSIKIKSDLSNKKTERFDFMLVNCLGNVDILEIKKPYGRTIINSVTDRDNYYPSNWLSATIMQIEKYLYHLNKWGYEGEKAINDKYGCKLPNNLSIRIANPKGLVIMGECSKLSNKQINDLEIIKKMYSNIVEIITYDDLIKRLKNVIEALKND